MSNTKQPAADAPAAAKPKTRPRGKHQVPGSTWTYTPGKGVWDDRGRQLLDWCPVVTENLITYRDDGRPMGRSVTFQVGPHKITAEIGEIENGKAWEAMPGAAGTADNRVRDALTNTISDQARKLPETVAHPRWVGDQLQLPPPECLPQGYLEQGGTFEGWCELMNRSADAPKIALVISLAVAGIYVKPCRRKSYVVHMKGMSSRGKSTTMFMAAGIFGNPDENQVVENWNSTDNGIVAWLKGLRVLPGFRDELQSAGFTPSKTQDLMFRVTGGGTRGQSTKVGGYRKPPAGWHSTLVSTGNISIVGNASNTAMFARVLEIDTPFTASAEQAEAFEEMALEHYGWGLPAILKQGVTPDEWNQWCAKALVALGNPSGDVLRRAGKHLAGAVAAARLLGRIIGNDQYESIVLEAGKEALDSIASDLGYKGTNSPSQQFLLALMDTMARLPHHFPTPETWKTLTNDIESRPPEIYGWNISNDAQDGEVALLPSGFNKIATIAEITDPLITLKELNRVGQLCRNKSGRALQKQMWINGERRYAYVISGLSDLAEDLADYEQTPAISTNTSTNTPTNTKSGPDQATTNTTNKIQPTFLVTCETATDDALLAIIASSEASDAELDAAATELEHRETVSQTATERPEPHSEGVHTKGQCSGRPQRSQSRKSSAPKGRKTGPDSQITANAQVSDPTGGSAADPARRAPSGAATAAGRAAYMMREGLTEDELLAIIASSEASDADLDAALVELEQRETVPQTATGRPEPHSEGAHTRGRGLGRPRRSQTAKAARGSRIATNAQVSDPSAGSAEHWDRWLADDGTRAALDRAGITPDPDLARRALVAWHRITAGLAWDATPGRVGRNLHRRLRATHPNMPEITPMKNEQANGISTGKNILVRTDFLNPHIRPEVGQHITSADVNNQFLSAASMAVLGDGEPVTIKRVRDISLILKDPGYLILSTKVTVPDHPAFAGRELSAGTAIPIPLAAYLHEWDVKLPVKEAVVWEKSGQRLKKHAEKLKEFLTEARKWKTWEGDNGQQVRDAAAIVEIAVKNVYAVTYGGQIRSERYAGDMLRRDWSDMIVALSYANALRALDRAAYGVPVNDPETGKHNTYAKVTDARTAGQPMGAYALGLVKDTAYFLHDDEEPTLPDGLEVPATRQFGKWKLEKHVSVTDDIAGAYEHGITALRNAINAEWKAAQK